MTGWLIMSEDTRITEAFVLKWIAGQKNKALHFLDESKDDMSLLRASKSDLSAVIAFLDDQNSADKNAAHEALADAALDVRHKAYGNCVFFRGLIEFTNYCKNDCYYCGIGRSQSKVRRYLQLHSLKYLLVCRRQLHLHQKNV